MPRTMERREREVVAARDPQRVVAPALPAAALHAPDLDAVHGEHGNEAVLAALTAPGSDGLTWWLRRRVALSAAGASCGPQHDGSQQVARAWLHRLGRGGAPLSERARARLEAAFARPLDHVRVHDDPAAHAAAEALNAHAFALGSHVYFAQGAFAPGTPQGDRLLAHELTHVVQHDEGRLPRGGGVSDPTDRHEREAYANEGPILARLDALPPGLQEGVAAIESAPIPTHDPAKAASASLDAGATALGAGTFSRSEASAGARPKEVRLTLLGVPMRVALPQGAEREVDVALHRAPVQGLDLHGLTLRFDESWALASGTARCALRFPLGATQVDAPIRLDIDKKGVIRPTLAEARLDGAVSGKVSGAIAKEGLRADADLVFNAPHTLPLPNGGLTFTAGSRAKLTIRDGSLRALEATDLAASVTLGGITGTLSGPGRYTAKEGLTAQGTVTLPAPITVRLFGYGATLDTHEAPVGLKVEKSALKSLQGDFGVTLLAPDGAVAQGRYHGTATDAGLARGEGSLHVHKAMKFGLDALHLAVQPGLDATFTVADGGLGALALDGADLALRTGDRDIARVTANHARWDGSSLDGDFTATLDPNLSFTLGPLSVAVKADAPLGIAWVDGQLSVSGEGLEVNAEWKKGKGLLMKALKWLLQKGKEGIEFVGRMLQQLLGLIDLSSILDFFRNLVDSLGIPEWLVALIEKLGEALAGLGELAMRVLEALASLVPDSFPLDFSQLVEWLAAMGRKVLEMLAGLSFSLPLDKLWELLAALGERVLGWLSKLRFGGAMRIEEGEAEVGLRGTEFPEIAVNDLKGSLWWDDKRLATFGAKRLAFDGETFTATFAVAADETWSTRVGGKDLALSGANTVTMSAGVDEPMRLGLGALDATLSDDAGVLARGRVQGLSLHEGGVDGQVAAALERPYDVRAGAFTVRVVRGSIAAGLKDGVASEAQVTGHAQVLRADQLVATATLTGLGLGRDGLQGSISARVVEEIELPLRLALKKGASLDATFAEGRLAALHTTGFLRYRAPLKRKPLPIEARVEKGAIDVASALVTARATATLKEDVTFGSEGRQITVRKGTAISASLRDSALESLGLADARLAAQLALGGRTLRAQGGARALTWTESEGISGSDVHVNVVPFAISVGATEIAFRAGRLGLNVGRDEVLDVTLSELGIDATLGGRRFEGTVSRGVYDVARGVLSELRASVKLPSFRVGGRDTFFAAEKGASVGLELYEGSVAAVRVDGLRGAGRVANRFDAAIEVVRGRYGPDGLDADVRATSTRSDAFSLGLLALQVREGSVFTVGFRASEPSSVGVERVGVQARIGGGLLAGQVTQASYDGALSLGADVAVAEAVALGLGPWSASLTSGTASVRIEADALAALSLDSVEGSLAGPLLPDLAFTIESGTHDGASFSGSATAALNNPYEVGLLGLGVRLDTARFGVGVDGSALTRLTVAAASGALRDGGVDVLMWSGSGAWDVAEGGLTELHAILRPGAAPLAPLGEGLVAISDLSGSFDLGPEGIDATATGQIHVPSLADLHGAVKVVWSRRGETDDFTGTEGTFDWAFGDDGERQLSGTVTPKLVKDGLELAADLGWVLADGMEGVVRAVADADLDLLVEKVEVPIGGTLLHGDTLFETTLPLLPDLSFPVFGPLELSMGMYAALGVDVDDLVVTGVVKNQAPWRPLRDGLLPDFRADLDVAWGLDLEGLLAAYVAAKIDLSLARLSAGVRGQTRAAVRTEVGADAWLQGKQGALHGGVSIGLVVDPTVEVSIVPYVSAWVSSFYEDGAPIELDPLVLGTMDGLFRFEWGQTYGLGDDRGKKETADAVPAAGAVQVGRTDEIVEGVEALPADESATAPQTSGAMTPVSGEDVAGPEVGGVDGGALGELRTLAQQLKAVGDGIAGLNVLVGLVKGFISALRFGPFGVLVWAIFEWLFGDLSWGKISDAVSAIGGAIEAGGALLKKYLPDTYADIERVFSGEALDEFLHSDDRMRVSVQLGEYRGQSSETLAEMCLVMMHGHCHDEDEQAILRVLRYAQGTGQFREVVTRIGEGSFTNGIARLDYDIDGSEKDQWDELLTFAGVADRGDAASPAVVFASFLQHAHVAVKLRATVELMTNPDRYQGLTWVQAVRRMAEVSPLAPILSRPMAPGHPIGDDAQGWLELKFSDAIYDKGLMRHEAALEPVYTRSLADAHAGRGPFAAAARFARETWLWEDIGANRLKLWALYGQAYAALLDAHATRYLPAPAVEPAGGPPASAQETPASAESAASGAPAQEAPASAAPASVALATSAPTAGSSSEVAVASSPPAVASAGPRVVRGVVGGSGAVEPERGAPERDRARARQLEQRAVYTLRPPDPALVGDASAKARAGESLTDTEAHALLDQVVVDTRSVMWSQQRSLAWDKVKGQCGDATVEASLGLEALGVDPRAIVQHQAEYLFREEGEERPNTLHVFAVVELGNGRRYLLDPTHAQFYGDGQDALHGARMLPQVDGERVAGALLRRGWVELTDDVANAFAQAMRLEDGRRYHADDYFDPSNRERTVAEVRKDYLDDNPEIAAAKIEDLTDPRATSAHDQGLRRTPR